MKQEVTTGINLHYGQTSELLYKKLTDESFELLKQENIPAAVNFCKQALTIDSSKVEANYGLGIAYLHYCQKQKIYCENSLFYLNKAIKINDNYRSGYFNRGQCKGSIGDYKGALEDFNKAIQQNSKDADAYFCRAMIKIKLQDNQGACEDFHKSGLLGDETARKLFEKNCGIKKK
jgi:tetratricopeptide (TPR) repeat protein